MKGINNINGRKLSLWWRDLQLVGSSYSVEIKWFSSNIKGRIGSDITLDFWRWIL